LNDGQIQNPSNPFEIVPLSNFVPRGFGFVHHSIAILDDEVPNPNITVRNFLIAVTRAVRLRNVDAALTAMAAAGLALGDVRAADVVDGDRAQSLALLWSMMRHWQVRPMGAAVEHDAPLAGAAHGCCCGA
jgi:hypothetical protein